MNTTVPTPSRQRGATLIVGLVLLLVLSVLAISTMSGATFGLTMAGNVQYSENAFQMAETAIDLSVANYNNGGSPPLPLTIVPDPNGGEIGRFTAATTFQEATAPPPREGGAFSTGSGSNTFEACHFQTQATGTSSRGASSQNTQEFYVICPGGS